MKMFIKTIITITLIINYIETSKYLISNRKGCSVNDQHRIDRIASKFYSPGPNAPYLPENYGQLKPFCNDLRNVTKTIEKFMLNCYTNEVLQYAKIIFYSINRQIRNYCTKRSKRLSKLLKIAPCMNQHLRTETICLDNWLRDFSHLPDIKSDGDKIIYGCCLTADAYICFDELIQKYECSRNNRDLILDFIKNISSDLQSVCGEYTHQSDACDSKRNYLQSQINKQQTNNDKNNQSSLITRRQQALQFKTPMFVLIDLLDSFDSPDLVVESR